VKKFIINQSGSGTILNICIISVIAFFCLSIITISNIFFIKTKTQKVADLSALSATQRLIYGAGDACDYAMKIAKENSVNLASCNKIAEYKVIITVSKTSIFKFIIKSSATADK
jgi:secretion/DNA translocation related TadE-like protein